MLAREDIDGLAMGDDIVTLSPLQELSGDIISEGIKSQIRNPYKSRVDFLEQFGEEFEEDMEELDEDSEEYMINLKVAFDFYCDVLDMIDQRFSLELDMERITGEFNLENIQNLAEGLYTFFILKYQRNIAKYLISYIIDNEDTFAKALKKVDTDDDNVAYTSLSQKLSDPKYILIITHINELVRTIQDTDIDPEDFIQYYNQDKFEVAVVADAIDRNLITGNFIPSFLHIVFGSGLEDDTYDDIIGNVQHALFKRYIKKEPIQIEVVMPEPKEEGKEKE